MDIREAQEKLGGWKRWQLTLYMTISVTSQFISSWHMLAIIYIGFVPEHHCNVNPELIPNATDEELYAKETCLVYDEPGNENSTRQCNRTTEGWFYLPERENGATKFEGSTIVTQWDLVCNTAHLKDFSQMVLVFGVMIGAMFFTGLSDFIGRKPVLFFCLWAISIIGVITAFVPNLYAFIALRFFTGALQQGVMLIGTIMAIELFATQYRTFFGIIIQNFWAIGSCFLTLFAYLIVDWQYLQLAISLCGVLTIPLYWVVPESLIWLCANNYHDEAEKIVQIAAKINKIEMPAKILNFASDSNSAKREERTLFSRFKKNNNQDENKNESARYTLLDLFRNRHLTTYIVAKAILWMVISMVFYGLTLSTATLAGDRLVNAFLNGLVEIPAYTSSFFVLHKFGRRKPLIVYHCIAGVSLILTPFIPLETEDEVSLVWLHALLNMIGKFGITAAFGIVLLYSPEVFPTTIRGQAIGVLSLVGRIGNLLASLTPSVSLHYPWLPAPLFGTLAIAAGLLVLLLPETHNRPLPQTIEDVENWSKGIPPRQIVMEIDVNPDKKSPA